MQRQITDEKLLEAIADPDHKKLIQLIPNLAEFSSAITDFPQHKQKLYDRVLLAFNDLPEYRKQFNSEFPTNPLAAQEKLFHQIIKFASARSYALKEKKAKKESFSNIDKLYKAAKKLNTEDGEALVRKVLSDQNEYMRLIKEAEDVGFVADGFPRLEKMLASIVLKKPSEFDRIVKNPKDLKLLTEKLPYYAEAFINKILDDPVQFERVVSPFDLPLLEFQDVPILDLTDYDEALVQVAERAKNKNLNADKKNAVHRVSVFNKPENNMSKESLSSKNKDDDTPRKRPRE